ncbi:ArdC family protein [Vibrio cincinnatiensis]
MAQQNSPQTRSNPNQATSVSTLDHESSPKNDACLGSNFNVVTMSVYSNKNQELLDEHKQLFDLVSSEWAGFRQWVDIGRKVKKGSKGCQIIMLCDKKIESTKKQEEEEKRKVIKTLYVFNKDQTEAFE